MQFYNPQRCQHGRVIYICGELNIVLQPQERLERQIQHTTEQAEQCFLILLSIMMIKDAILLLINRNLMRILRTRTWHAHAVMVWRLLDRIASWCRCWTCQPTTGDRKSLIIRFLSLRNGNVCNARFPLIGLGYLQLLKCVQRLLTLDFFPAISVGHPNCTCRLWKERDRYGARPLMREWNSQTQIYANKFAQQPTLPWLWVMPEMWPYGVCGAYGVRFGHMHNGEDFEHA